MHNLTYKLQFLASNSKHDKYTYVKWFLSFFQCLSLILWLEERYETIYMRHPGFQKGSKPLLALDNPFPMELPENLFGEKWAFVQLPFSGISFTFNGVKQCIYKALELFFLLSRCWMNVCAKEDDNVFISKLKR